MCTFMYTYMHQVWYKCEASLAKDILPVLFFQDKKLNVSAPTTLLTKYQVGTTQILDNLLDDDTTGLG